MKFWEVAKFHMKPALGIANDAYIINTAALDKLPADLRLQFLRSSRSAISAARSNISNRKPSPSRRARQRWASRWFSFRPTS